jgi:hypothetical protein
MAYNKIPSIATGTFKDCGSIFTLDLFSNKISSIGDGAFNGLNSVESLILSKNNLV